MKRAVKRACHAPVRCLQSRVVFATAVRLTVASGSGSLALAIHVARALLARCHFHRLATAFATVRSQCRLSSAFLLRPHLFLVLILILLLTLALALAQFLALVLTLEPSLSFLRLRRCEGRQESITKGKIFRPGGTWQGQAEQIPSSMNCFPSATRLSLPSLIHSSFRHVNDSQHARSLTTLTLAPSSCELIGWATQ